MAKRSSHKTKEADKKNVSKPQEKASDQVSVSEINDLMPAPKWYQARGDGKFTPLIPLDELPETIKLVGVSVYVSSKELLSAQASALFPVIEKATEPYMVEVEQDERPRPSTTASEVGTARSEIGTARSMNVPSNTAIEVRSFQELCSSC